MWRGEEKKDAVSEMRREGDDGAATQETNGKARRTRKDVGPEPRTGTSGAGQEQAAKHQSRAPRTGASPGRIIRGRGTKWTGTSRKKKRREGVRKEPGLERPGSRNPGLELPGNRRVAW